MQTDSRALDSSCRYPAGLKLAHLTTQHLVPGFGVALKVDPSYVNALTRIDEEGELNFVRFLVDTGDRVDIGERITLFAEPGAQISTGLRDLLAREHLASTDGDEIAQLLGGHNEIAGKLDVLADELRTFVAVDGDVDIILVRRERHLGGLDAEVDVAAIQVERTQLLQVRRQPLTRVLVTLRQPGEHTAGIERKQI